MADRDWENFTPTEFFGRLDFEIREATKLLEHAQKGDKKVLEAQQRLCEALNMVNWYQASNSS